MPTAARTHVAGVLAVLAVLMPLVALAGCGDAPPATSQRPTTAVSPPPDRDPPLNDAVESGVGVIATGCGPSPGTGSGAVVGLDGQVLTVAHTVAGADGVRVIDRDGVEYDATLLTIDAAADLAVFDVPGLEVPPLSVSSATAVERGPATQVRWTEDAGVHARTVEVTQRLAITIDDIYGSNSVQRSGFAFAADVVVGDSGGPIVDGDGSVVGVVYARSLSRAGTAFATDAGEIADVLAAAAETRARSDREADGAPVEPGACV